MLDFVEINKDNIHWYCKFENIFEKELRIFQSRIYPHNSDFFVPLTEYGALKWSYMFYGGKIIGAIWLEKEHTCLRTAQLGIFIADKEMRNKGIGTKAIIRFICENKKAMKLTEVTLNVRTDNIRAIRCYEKCGFECEQKFKKADGTKVMKMINYL
ncbi:MAG: GNAT family N-acetyltransferase [Oscillospiraceae bacterium]|nr:GNAT family N-acetyltransferase [Oscillospiraceae bacterium]